MVEVFRSLKHPKALMVALLGGGLMLTGVVLTMATYRAQGDVTLASVASEIAKDLDVPILSRLFGTSQDAAPGTTDATGAADGEVTRGASPAQAPVGAEAGGEKPVVCIRRAGELVCN